MMDAIIEHDDILRAFPGNADRAIATASYDGLLHLSVVLVYDSGQPWPQPYTLGDRYEIDWPDGTRRTFIHTEYEADQDRPTRYTFVQTGPPR